MSLTKTISCSLIGVLGALYVGWGSSVHGYMEDTFFCSVQDNTIRVTLHTGDQLCFSHMAQLSDHILRIDTDIQKANMYILDKESVVYRTMVKKDLIKQKEPLMQLREQMNLALVDFEKELFTRTKRIVGYYLLPIMHDLQKKIDTAISLMEYQRLLGKTDHYPTIRTKIDQLSAQLVILEHIQSSKTLEELLPLLRIYIQGGYEETATSTIL